MIRPHPLGTMWRSAFLVPQKVWLRLKSSSNCHSSSVMSMIGADWPTPPALRTMMSSWPKWSTV